MRVLPPEATAEAPGVARVVVPVFSKFGGPVVFGIKEDDVITMFDKYCEEGGTQMSFMTDVFLPIYQVSGFFSRAQADTMDKKLVEAKELM